MDLSRHIKTVLFRSERVIISGLGAFLAHYIPAQIEQEDQFLYPPKKRVNFNAKIINTDDVLEHFISTELNIAYKEASETITSFVKEVKQSLENNGSFNFHGLGVLHQDEAGNLYFDCNSDLNLLPESYGMEPVYVPKLTSKTTPVSETEVEREPVSEPSFDAIDQRHNNLKRILLFVPLIAILIFLILQINWENDTFNNIFTDKKTTEQKIDDEPKKESSQTDNSKSASASRSELEEKIDQMTEAQKALDYETNQTKQTSEQYHIIAGSFASKSNALVYKRELEKKGYKPTLLERDGNGYRVAIKTYNNKPEALNELYRLRDTYKESLWLLSQ